LVDVGRVLDPGPIWDHLGDHPSARAVFYSWLPDLDALVDRELAASPDVGWLSWLKEVAASALPRAQALETALVRETRVVKKAAIDAEPFAFKGENGIYFANWTGSHAGWKEALLAALKTVPNPDPEGENIPTPFTLLMKLTGGLQVSKLDQLAARLERKNKRRPRHMPGTKTDTAPVAEMQAFARRVPGTQVMVWHGLRYTHLAETVFTRLYAKLRIWAAELARTPAGLRRQWVSESAVYHFLERLNRGQVFLIEMDTLGYPGELDSKVGGYVYAFHPYLSRTKELGINLKFRRQFMGIDDVVSENALFATLMHEVAHLLNPSWLREVEVFELSLALRLKKMMRLVDKQTKLADADVQSISHGRTFWAAFQFNWNIAVRAGLVNGGVQDWAIAEDPERAMEHIAKLCYITERAGDLEQRLTKEGAIKRTRETEQWSSFSDDDEQDAVDARFIRLFSRYLGTPVSVEQILSAVDHWDAHGLRQEFVRHVCASSSSSSI
jgi:hypothetical protein